MTKVEEKLETHALVILALPIVAETLLQTLLGTVDTYFAGSLSDAAIAGVGVTSITMNVFIAFFAAVGTGSVALVARRHGANDRAGVGAAVSASIALACILGIFIGLLCTVFAEPILALSGLEPHIAAYTMPYFIAVAAPSVTLALQMALSSCLRALEDTRAPMFATGAANLLNMALDAAFIALGWGVLGLGIATSLSRGFAAIALFACIMRRPGAKSRITHPRAADLLTLIHVGAPAGAEKLVMRTGQLIYTAVIVSLGTEAYVAHNIAGAIESYAYIPAMGFGLAASTAVGNALGEGNPEKARCQTWGAWRITTIAMLAIAACFFVFGRELASLFTQTPEVQELAASVLRIIALFQPLAALVQVLTGALQGAGDTCFPLISTALGIWGIRLGIGYILAVPCGMGLIGIWCAYALDVTVRGLLLYVRFRKGAWTHIEL